jgi:uncharacterized membrane protein YeaQ/YmgE (transglycosylase-associated protein family)
MKLIQTAFFGALIGFCGTMLHNFNQPIGLILSLILTYVGFKAVGQKFIYLRYQVIAAASWLALIIRAGTQWSGDEILITGNTFGNLFLLGGFITIVISMFKSRSKFN